MIKNKRDNMKLHMHFLPLLLMQLCSLHLVCFRELKPITGHAQRNAE